jgi:hypothetical protein
MTLKNLAFLSSLPLMAVGVLGTSISAEAAVLFNTGDKLTITGDVDSSTGKVINPATGLGTEFRFFNTLGTPVPAFGFGNVRVNPTSTGVFEGFETTSTDANSKIRSFDIADIGGDVLDTGVSLGCGPGDAATNFLCNPAVNPTGNALKVNGSFLELERGLSPNAPDITINLDQITKFITTPDPITGELSTFVSAKATFFADNQAVGTGSFNASFDPGQTDTTFAGTFIVEVPTVPEPTTTLGLLALGALGATRLTKRKQSRKTEV